MEKIQPQISGNVKFSPYLGIDFAAEASDLSKLSPAVVIVIGLSVTVFGLYLLSKDKEEASNSQVEVNQFLIKTSRKGKNF